MTTTKNGEVAQEEPTVRYYGENPRMRATRTEQVRFRLMKRGSREPLLVLQLEEKHEEFKITRGGGYWKIQDGTQWRDATLEDLSVMDISKLTISREGGEMPICFRPRWSIWTGWALVLQIMQGSVGQNTWADAKMGDLLFKEGKILGGVGLVSR